MTIQGPDTGLLGDNLNFRCLVNNANPVPDVQWVVNGRQVSPPLISALNIYLQYIHVSIVFDYRYFCGSMTMIPKLATILKR